MTDLSSDIGVRSQPASSEGLSTKIGALSRAGLSERLFTLSFFRPRLSADLGGSRSRHGSDGAQPRIIAWLPSRRAAAMCLLISPRSPARIDAVDLNAAHVALNRMKIAAVRHLPSHADLFRFFGSAGNGHNSAAYDRFIAPNLDRVSRSYWERRNWLGGRRITVFERNFYHTGLLGFFIALGHFVARLHGVGSVPHHGRTHPCGISAASSRNTWLRSSSGRCCAGATTCRASLFGLGIPPAQYDLLITSGDGTMADVLWARLEKLACHFPLQRQLFCLAGVCAALSRAGRGRTARLPAAEKP